MPEIVFYSAMYQAVPHLLEIQKLVGGAIVTSRRSTARAIEKIHGCKPILINKSDSTNAGREDPLAAARVIVTGSPYQSLLYRYNGKKVMTFHGTYAYASRENAVSLRHFDFLCMIGPRMRDMLGRHAELSVTREITGYLPFHGFPDIKGKAELRHQILESIGLDPTLTTVLYTPTSSPTGSLQSALPEILGGLPANFNLIVRPHPRDTLKSSLSRFAKLVQLSIRCKRRRNTVLERSVIPLPSLQAISDLLISDGNSPSEDILFYGTPQIIINHPTLSVDIASKQMREDGFHPEDIERQLAFQFGLPTYQEGKNSFQKALNEALSWSGQYQRVGKAHFDWVFGSRDINAAQNVSRVIEKLLAAN